MNLVKKKKHTRKEKKNTTQIWASSEQIKSVKTSRKKTTQTIFLIRWWRKSTAPNIVSTYCQVDMECRITFMNLHVEQWMQHRVICYQNNTKDNTFFHPLLKAFKWENEHLQPTSDIKVFTQCLSDKYWV